MGRALTWNTIWLKFSSSRSSGCSNCSALPFSKNIWLPFGKTSSSAISVKGSPKIGNSFGVVRWSITAGMGIWCEHAIYTLNASQSNYLQLPRLSSMSNMMFVWPVSTSHSWFLAAISCTQWHNRMISAAKKARVCEMKMMNFYCCWAKFVKWIRCDLHRI